jgi:hypothetical protein
MIIHGHVLLIYINHGYNNINTVLKRLKMSFVMLYLHI